MKSKTRILILLIVMFILGMATAFFRSNQEGFTGSRIKNPDSYMLDIEWMNGTDLHTLELQNGDILQIQFETLKGSLYMEIKAPNGTIIYRGNGKETMDFTVNISESGVYAVVVEARHAKGLIQVQCEQKDNSMQTEDIMQTENSVQKSVELVGPWHLDDEKNDLDAFADSLDLFPGYGEWGASMEIRSNGQMSWYIGAEGWNGTYTLEDGAIHAQMTSDLEESTQLWEFRITEEEGKAELEMDYQDMTIYWIYGDQE